MDPASTEPAVRAPRLPATERRDQILEAATRIFAAQGYHGAGTADIARACGCSEPVIYKHFASKRALYTAVLEYAHAEAAQHIAELETSSDPLGDLLKTATRLYGTDAFSCLTQVRLGALQLVDEPDVRETLRRSIARLHEKVATAVRRAQELGQARDGIDPDEIAWIWVSIAMSSGVRQALWGTRELGRVPDAAAQLIELIRRG